MPFHRILKLLAKAKTEVFEAIFISFVGIFTRSRNLNNLPLVYEVSFGLMREAEAFASLDLLLEKSLFGVVSWGREQSFILEGHFAAIAKACRSLA